jgi:cytochrome b6-f complex iron-sulfur subunit
MSLHHPHEHPPTQPHEAATPCASQDPTGRGDAEGSCPGCPNAKRRQFLKGALFTVAAAWAGMTLYPFVRYLASAAEQDPTEQVSSVTVGKPDDIPMGSAKNFKFGSQPAIVYRDPAGNFHAYSAVCTHLGCTVQYKADVKKIYCACHGGTYDPDTGKNIAGPPPKPLPGLNVAVVNGQVVVSRA